MYILHFVLHLLYCKHPVFSTCPLYCILHVPSFCPLQPSIFGPLGLYLVCRHLCISSLSSLYSLYFPFPLLYFFSVLFIRSALPFCPLYTLSISLPSYFHPLFVLFTLCIFVSFLSSLHSQCFVCPLNSLCTSFLTLFTLSAFPSYPFFCPLYTFCLLYPLFSAPSLYFHFANPLFSC